MHQEPVVQKRCAASRRDVDPELRGHLIEILPGGRDAIRDVWQKWSELRTSLVACTNSHDSTSTASVTGYWQTPVKIFRNYAAALLIGVSLPAEHAAPSSWCGDVLRFASGLVAKPLTSSLLRTPSANTWTSLKAPRRSGIGVHALTIHQAKGREFDAVLLAIPHHRTHTPELLAAWNDGVTTEALRVLYVGMTRARRLLAIATHPKLVLAFEERLASRGAVVLVVSPETTSAGVSLQPESVERGASAGGDL
jgi:Superfamily I DNA and RNA helicases